MRLKVKYFEDTDTLHIDFQGGEIAETRDLDKNTLRDLDAEENVCAVIFAHASKRTDVGHLHVEGIAA